MTSFIRSIVVLLFLLSGKAYAAQPIVPGTVEICFNYSCISKWQVEFDAPRLQEILKFLGEATTPEEEREHLGLAVGRLYALAAEQAPIGNDRGGNYSDGGVYGRMDCIDHSRTTTRFLKLLEQNNGLRWHKVLEPARRGIIFQHFSAVVEVLHEPEKIPPERYVVDSWFVDNGKPAVILPLAAWMQGEGPDVD